MSYVINLSVNFTPAQQTVITDALNAALPPICRGNLYPYRRRTIPLVKSNRFQYVDKAVFTLGPNSQTK